MAKQVAYGEATVRDADGGLSAGPPGPFFCIDRTPSPSSPDLTSSRSRRPRPRGLPRLLRPDRGRLHAICFACRTVAAPPAPAAGPGPAGLALPAAGPALLGADGLQGVAGRRGPAPRFARRSCAAVRRVLRPAPGAASRRSLGGAVDLVLPVPSSVAGRPPLAHVDGSARLSRRWRRLGGPGGPRCGARGCCERTAEPIGHMRPDPGAFAVPPPGRGRVAAPGRPARRHLCQRGPGPERGRGAPSRPAPRAVRHRRRSAGSSRPDKLAAHAASWPQPRRPGRRTGCARCVVRSARGGGRHRVAHAGQLLGDLPQRGPPSPRRGPAGWAAPALGGPKSPKAWLGPMYWPPSTPGAVAA